VDATVPKTPNGKPHNVPSTIHRPKVTA
jgi:hypothetical protein